MSKGKLQTQERLSDEMVFSYVRLSFYQDNFEYDQYDNYKFDPFNNINIRHSNKSYTVVPMPHLPRQPIQGPVWPLRPQTSG